MNAFDLLLMHHPLLAFCALLIVGQLATWPFRLVNRLIRHLNIKAAGWPPEHLDADGDVKSGTNT